MLIPTGMHYFATAEGTFWKIVTCEQCRTTYAYRMKVSATGVGSSPLFLDNEGARARASLGAEATLLRKAERLEVPIPCPACGWYQRSMVRLLRRKVHWGHTTGVVALVLSPLLLLLDDLLGLMLTGLVAACGLALIVTGFVVRWRSDPNAGDPEPRKQLGQSLTVWGKGSTRSCRKRKPGDSRRPRCSRASPAPATGSSRLP